jgi:GAF domain-containing protein
MLARIIRQFDSFRDQPPRLDIDWNEVHHMLLDFCVRIIPKVVSAEHCSIYIHDPARPEVWLKAGTGTDEKEIDVLLDEDSIVSEVIRTGKSIVINDLEQKQEILDKIDQDPGFVANDILCVPIRSLDGQKVMGAVQLLNRMYGHKFSDADLKLMQEMALFLEQSLENVYYRSLTQGVVQRAALITRVTSFLGLALLLGLTGAFTLWVMWVAIESFL